MRKTFGIKVVVAISVILLFAVVCYAVNYGYSWTLGRYYMPVTILASDGIHCMNGLPADPITRVLVHYDWEAEYLLTVLIGISAGLGYAFYLTRDTAKKRQQILRKQLEIEALRRFGRKSGAVGAQ
jgi:hypothetical protein